MTKRSLERTIRVNLIRDQIEIEEVLYWVPPTQLEDTASDLNYLLLINECLDLICETIKPDDLRVEKLARIYLEICFYKNYLCASIDVESDFFMRENSRLLLELADLGDELDVDKHLIEIENPLFKNNHENVNICKFDFVFLPNAFDSQDHLNLKEHFIIDATYLVKLFDEK
ncbi:hypothetical protein IGI04_002475, partial [Brassica rapa subsp. trilocularis]